MIRVVFVGGFLGAGKTTLLLRTASSLRDRGLEVGIVTNDQSTDLVDTRLVQLLDFPVGEVAGGCFCCQFGELTKAFETIQEGRNVDVILAEPVGSCTDIISTVVRPLAEMRGDRYEVAPFTVVVDPTREPQPANSLSGYLYSQQIAEADAIVVSKMDLAPDGLTVTKHRYQGFLPEREIFPISALSGEGVDAWLNSVLSAPRGEGASLTLDYQKYAQAEAELGWLNGSGRWQTSGQVRLQDAGEELLRSLRGALYREPLEAAHVKLMLITAQGQFKGGFTAKSQPFNWEATNASAKADKGELVLNARVKASPDALAAAVTEVLTRVEKAIGLRVVFHQWECFSPKPPRPTFRLNRYGVSVPLECSNPLLATQ